MVTSPINYCLECHLLSRSVCLSRSICHPERSEGSVGKKSLGLTLIEVLIALAIVGIALTAVIKATSENIRSRSYLQNKTIAMWVGERVINEVRAGVIKLQLGQELKEKSNMGGRDWYWQANEEETGNRRIHKINVQVFANEEDENAPLMTLDGYLYREE